MLSWVRLIVLGASIYDVRREKGEGVKKCTNFADKKIVEFAGKEGGGRPKILWTSQMEAPFCSDASVFNFYSNLG